MIEKICTFLTKKIREENPEMTDEKAEVIYFGLQNIVGEIPKILLMLVIAFILGIFELALFTFLVMYVYKGASGGLHLKSHIGCIILTTAFYCIIPFVSERIIIAQNLKYIIVSISWIIGMFLIKKYAPADTEDIPILEEKVRKKKRMVAYIAYTVALIISLIIPNNTISNILIIANIVQTLTITRIAYKLTDNKYGHEVYKFETQ